MPTPNPTKKKPIRYMDFISRKPSENSDPLASRPDSRPVKHVKPIAKAPSVADQIPPKGAHIHKAPVKAPEPAPELTVKKDEDRPLISRKPATSRDLYAEPIDPDKPKVTTVDKPVDDLAIKASAALSGNSQPAEKAPDGSAYSLGGKSPFLPNYTVDKRPLSNSVPTKKNGGEFERLSYLGVSDQGPDTSRRKNVYERAEEPDGVPGDETIKIIDDTKKKQGAPTWLIIIITIILGAPAGAGVYFLLPK